MRLEEKLHLLKSLSRVDGAISVIKDDGIRGAIYDELEWAIELLLREIDYEKKNKMTETKEPIITEEDYEFLAGENKNFATYLEEALGNFATYLEEALGYTDERISEIARGEYENHLKKIKKGK